VAFSFMIPTLIFLGVLYASVSARFVFFRLFEGTRHKGNHTVVGWASWAGILACTWVLAFIIAEVIPFFSYLLSLMSSLFDSFFGFIFWGVAGIRLRKADRVRNIWLDVLDGVMILIGLFFLTGGTYASVEAIVQGYEAGSIKLFGIEIDSLSFPKRYATFVLIVLVLLGLAIANLRRICEGELSGRYEMEVVDVLERPQLAEDEKILATPTVVKELPHPIRRIIGDLSDSERVLLGLDLRPTGDGGGPAGEA